MIRTKIVPFARPLALLALLAAPMVGCGEPTEDTTDGGTEPPPFCEGADNQGFTAATQTALVAPDDPATTEADGILNAFADTSETAPLDELSVEIYESFGGSLATGTYTIQDVNYADCGLCVLIYADCAEGQPCNKIFYANEGTVEITQLDQTDGGRFVATVTDAKFQEVTIDENTFESTPVADGENWCVESFNFDAEVVIPQ